jgi:hypothetical protein
MVILMLVLGLVVPLTVVTLLTGVIRAIRQGSTPESLNEDFAAS